MTLQLTRCCLGEGGANSPLQHCFAVDSQPAHFLVVQSNVKDLMEDLNPLLFKYLVSLRNMSPYRRSHFIFMEPLTNTSNLAVQYVLLETTAILNILWLHLDRK